MQTFRARLLSVQFLEYVSRAEPSLSERLTAAYAAFVRARDREVMALVRGVEAASCG